MDRLSSFVSACLATIPFSNLILLKATSEQLQTQGIVDVTGSRGDDRDCFDRMLPKVRQRLMNGSFCAQYGRFAER